jgi:hypothetical protein
MPLERLKVFISWSGERSRAVAEALRDWLPDILPLCDPFLSTEDIEKGAKWRQAISGALQNSDVSIVCLTPENLTSPWLLFEAGAIAKHAESRVWTYLTGLKYADVKDPLSEFQHTAANREDTEKLIKALNRHLNEGALTQERLKKAFDRWWPDMEKKLKAVPPPPGPAKTPADPIAKVLDMTTEILERVREQSKGPTVDPDRIRDDDDRIDMSSVVSDVLMHEVKASGMTFWGVGTCMDGAYSINQKDRGWRIEKRVAEDLALGRIKFAQVLASAVQMKNPCMPNAETSVPEVKLSAKKVPRPKRKGKK